MTGASVLPFRAADPGPATPPAIEPRWVEADANQIIRNYDIIRRYASWVGAICDQLLNSSLTLEDRAAFEQ